MFEAGGWASALVSMDEPELLELIDSDTFIDLDPSVTSLLVDAGAAVPGLTATDSLHVFRDCDVEDLAIMNATRVFVEECAVADEDIRFEDSVYDANQSSLATTSSSPSDSDSSRHMTPTDTKAVAAKPARRSRIRPKEELAVLRRQEQAMVTTLRELRLEARRQVARSSQTGGSQNYASREHSVLFWERAASRQLQYLRLAEEDNRGLKTLLQLQMRQTRQLQQALARRVIQSESLESKNPVARRIPRDNAAVFEVLLSDIDLLPSAIGDTPFVEHCRISSVPFRLRHVQRAVWMAVRTKKNRANPNFYRTFAQDSGVILRSSASSLVPQAEYPLYVQSQATARVFTERQRVIIISKALMEPKGLQRGESLGIKYAEINVHILTPGEDDSPSSYTTIELRSAMSRYILPGPNAARWRREESTLIAKQMWTQALTGRNELLEAFLMDSSEP